MRLLIISNMSHYQGAGELVGWGPTVQEIDHLASLFEEIVHVGCLHDQEPPSSSLPYKARNLRLQLVPAAGGRGLRAKLEVLRRIPGWAREIRRALENADAVHVRCPANISLVALLLLFATKKPQPRWVKYAGNWGPAADDPWSYRLQRWLLRRSGHGAAVTINGKWPSQPDHVVPFHNPCLTRGELDEGRKFAICKALSPPFRLVFLGALIQGKGAGVAIRVIKRLSREDSGFVLEVVGDGPQRPALERMAGELGVEGVVRFHGFVPRTDVPKMLHRAHFLLHPSRNEGFPKVVAEGMAYGAVPVAGAVSGIRQLLEDTGAGIAIDPQDEQGFVDAIFRFVRHEVLWTEALEQGLAAAGLFTYDAYLKNVIELFETKFWISLSQDGHRTVRAS